MKVFVLFLVCGILSGCNLYDDTSAVSYEVLLEGFSSGFRNRSENVVTSREQWESLWQQHVINHPTPAPLPNVDFQTRCAALNVIYVFLTGASMIP